MKILFLSTWFPYPPDNGSKLRVHYLLRALTKVYGVTLVSFGFGTARPGRANALEAICDRVGIVSLDPFAASRTGPLRTFLSARPTVNRPIESMRRLVAEVICEESFDAVIASTEMMSAYALQVPRGTPTVLEEHNSMTRWMRERYMAQTSPVQRVRCWASWRKRRHFEARNYRHFDLVTMVSEADLATTLGTIGDESIRVELVPNGVDCKRNRPGLTEAKTSTLIFNGALTYSANYDAMQWFLGEIYGLIKARAPGVSISITGSTKGVDLQGLALDHSVHLTGYVEDVRLPVAEAAVCVVPVREGGGTRLKILEAMALGTPVVATSKGAEGLDVIDGEHLLLGDTPEAFAEAVLRVMTDSALRKRLCQKARALVEKRYDWEEIGAQFVALVEEVVDSR